MEIVLGWIPKHLDKPGFDEGVELFDLGFRLSNLCFDRTKLENDSLLSINGREWNLDLSIVLKVDMRYG